MPHMPVSEEEIEHYLDKDKQDELLAKVKSAYANKQNLELQNVKFEYIDSPKPCEDILGNYNQHTKTITINKYDIKEKINIFGRKIETENYRFLLCDLIFIHECIHAYQDQIEHKCMKKDDKFLEEDANRKAVAIFILNYSVSSAIKRSIVEYYINCLKKYTYQLGDGITVDSFIEELNSNL